MTTRILTNNGTVEIANRTSRYTAKTRSLDFNVSITELGKDRGWLVLIENRLLEDDWNKYLSCEGTLEEAVESSLCDPTDFKPALPADLIARLILKRMKKEF